MGNIKISFYITWQSNMQHEDGFWIDIIGILLLNREKKVWNIEILILKGILPKLKNNKWCLMLEQNGFQEKR